MWCKLNHDLCINVQLILALFSFSQMLKLSKHFKSKFKMCRFEPPKVPPFRVAVQLEDLTTPTWLTAASSTLSSVFCETIQSKFC